MRALAPDGSDALSYETGMTKTEGRIEGETSSAATPPGTTYWGFA